MKKLSSIKSEKIWGYENWIASTHPAGFQKELFEIAGGDYPLLVKVIQADDTLSVQVHPDDEKAFLFEKCRGKTEGWYVLSAKPNSSLICGLKGDYSKEEIKSAIENNSLEGFLRYEKVKKGDFVYIPSGTVHAICGGLRLLEVQQSSDVTYRLYDWGRGRECHIEKGVSCIKNSRENHVSSFQNSFSCPYFSLEKIDVTSSFSLSIEGEKRVENTILFFVLEGSGTINGELAECEDIFAFTPGETLDVKGKLKLIKIKPSLT